VRVSGAIRSRSRRARTISTASCARSSGLGQARLQLARERMTPNPPARRGECNTAISAEMWTTTQTRPTLTAGRERQ
jgi:hypothetical protein